MSLPCRRNRRRSCWPRPNRLLAMKHQCWSPLLLSTSYLARKKELDSVALIALALVLGYRLVAAGSVNSSEAGSVVASAAALAVALALRLDTSQPSE